MWGRRYVSECKEEITEMFRQGLSFEEIGKRVDFTPEAVRKYVRYTLRLTRKEDRIQRAVMGKTLCWDCAKAVCGCSWSIDFTPVEGWDAIPTKLTAQHRDTGEIDSFCVIDCPEFVSDKERKK